MFAALAWNTAIVEGNTITVDGQNWTVGAIDALRKDGGIYGKQAPLTRGIVTGKQIGRAHV